MNIRGQTGRYALAKDKLANHKFLGLVQERLCEVKWLAKKPSRF